MGFNFGIWKVIRSLIVDGVPVNVVWKIVLLIPFLGLEIVLVEAFVESFMRPLSW